MAHDEDDKLMKRVTVSDVAPGDVTLRIVQGPRGNELALADGDGRFLPGQLSGEIEIVHGKVGYVYVRQVFRVSRMIADG